MLKKNKNDELNPPNIITDFIMKITLNIYFMFFVCKRCAHPLTKVLNIQRQPKAKILEKIKKSLMVYLKYKNGIMLLKVSTKQIIQK